MNAELNEAFQAAFEKATHSTDKIPSDIMLKLYGLYKQATTGKAHPLGHNNHDLIKAFKFNAWQQVAHLDKEEAKELYIKLVNEIYPI